MNAYVKFFGCGCIALAALGCGSKGEDSDDGNDETGGTSGTGATGGSGTGGSSGSATGGSGGGGPLPIKQTYDFAADVQGWILIDSSAATTSVAVPDADIMIAHTADDGNPDPGAFEATIPYTREGQYVTFGLAFQSDDLTNRTITARVKVVSGLGDPTELMTTPGGSKIYAKSGMGYCYANGPYNNLGDMPHPIGEWQTITYNLARPPDYTDPNCATPFDPADVREIGIQFDTSGTAPSAETAVVRIDTVTY